MAGARDKHNFLDACETLDMEAFIRGRTLWVVWRRVPGADPVVVTTVARAEEAEPDDDCFLQEWNFFEAFRRELIDPPQLRALAKQVAEYAGYDGGYQKPGDPELTDDEKEACKGIDVFKVWYEDRFSHEGYMVDIFLTEEEANAEVATMGPVNMESGKFDGLYANAGTLAEFIGCSNYRPGRARALLLRSRAEAELKQNR